MKRLIFLIVLTLLTETTLKAQMKVAGYSFGKPGTDKYEHFSFWIKDGKRTAVDYVYGKDRKEVELKYLGRDQINGRPCFKVQFSNNYILYIIPLELHLKVVDAIGKYNETFEWEYEGPVNGIGTYCDVCAKDEEDAMKLIQTSYMK